MSYSGHWPPAEPPGLDAKAKRYRILKYQRITDLYECKLAIASGRLVKAAFEVTEQWFHAEQGVIEMPQEGADIVGSHAVTLIGYSDEEKRFKFINSWGEEWGDGGFGYLPYDFFNLYFVEAWIAGGAGQTPPGEMKSGVVEMCWALLDFAGRIFHAREFYDADSDERIGWGFAVQERDRLNVEELFVRPQYRRKGYGARLLQLLKKMSAEAGLPLRFFIPYADCQPENLAVAARLLSKAQYFIIQSDLPGSPYMAVSAINTQAPPLELPEPPVLCAPMQRIATDRMPISVNGEASFEQRDGALPVSEATELLKQPDWRSQSDEAFLDAAKATFRQHASLLRRLA
jgi:GNAT superfamily N-acetyltransferase